MKKVFLSADQLLKDSFALAEKVFLSDFKPNFIIGVWRGGAPVGIAIQEYLDYLGISADHIAIRTSSYFGIDQQDKNVRVDGLHYIVEKIKSDDKVLLVDDVFDSGRSVEAILNNLITETGRNMPTDIRVACPWFKPMRNKTEHKPDYYVHQTDDWLVFPHELSGLSLDEITKGKPELAKYITQHLS